MNKSAYYAHKIFIAKIISPLLFKASPRDVMHNVQNCDFVVSEFELQSRYCVHF